MMARAPKPTWDRIERMIESGDGSGFGHDYQPWIKIKWWNPSPISFQFFRPIPPFKRSYHFLSKQEYKLGLLFLWAGCEIREQFPIWPWEHSHPETGRNIAFDRYLPPSIGTIDLCKEAGIEHGNFVGTKIPYVWTMDFCLHLPWVSQPAKTTTFVSAKPDSQTNPKLVNYFGRTMEKLEIERRYCLALGNNYFVGDHKAFSPELMKNLDAIISCSFIPSSHRAYKIKQQFLDRHGHRLQKEHLGFSFEVLQKDFGCNNLIAGLIQNNMCWNQNLDIDLSKPMTPAQTPVPGGKVLLSNLRKNLEGIQ